ncbi:hypothetical protein LK994_11210 [Ferruginibacter lapsinanis]|uniref:hypothetical protein n=1 Tax=Ferruginibacter lapsinanis TaxID=563172 RepID=UPI001E51C145|nr:hypothetical protein [Ferruginibacter lapsinanis]UEG49199.1 hypothetical protein LK994_11210 [Ferruginibacter lapsinanis]
MSINLLEKIQQNLGYPVLQKIDPNTEEIVLDEKTPDEDRLSQAAIPSMLAGLYMYVQSDEGAIAFLRNNGSINWTSEIFTENKIEAIQKIAGYANVSDEIVVATMNNIANEAVKVVKENLTDAAAIKDIKLFFSNQRNTILLYLPAVLNMGVLLHNDSLDDSTNKMEGPISSLMQSLGSAFSTPVTDKEIKTQ